MLKTGMQAHKFILGLGITSTLGRLMVRPVSNLRSDIQALRALAVMSVVIYHIWPHNLPGGFMGVDIFFVISGYLMTLTLSKGLNQISTAGEKDNKVRSKGSVAYASMAFLLSFYARRIRRLAPAATVCLLAVLVAVSFIDDISLQMTTIPQVIASTVFLQNWLLAKQSVDYLGSDARATAVQHFWSLSIEEQFYMIWPILLLIIVLAGEFIIRRREGNTNLIKQLTLGAIILFTLIFFGFGYYLTMSNPTIAYFVSPARLWELSLGGVIVFLPLSKNRFSLSSRLLLPWLGLILICYMLVCWSGAAFPGWSALIPTLGTVLIIYGGIDNRAIDNEDARLRRTDRCSLLSIANLSRFSPLQFIGDVSYSLYLWHWPLIVLIPAAYVINLQSSTLDFKLAIFAASLWTAIVSYYAIEQPAKRVFAKKTWYDWRSINSIISKVNFKHRLPSRFLSINDRVTLPSIGLGVVCLSVVLVPALLQLFLAKESTVQAMKIAFHRAVDSDDIDFGARAITHKNEIDYNPYGQLDKYWMKYGTVQFSGTMADPDQKYSFGMDTPSDDYVGTFGDLNSEKTILVLGDSYSQQWYPAIDIAARNLGYKVIAANSITAGGGMYELESQTTKDMFTVANGVSNSIAKVNSRFNYIKNNLWQKADLIMVGIYPGYFSLSGESPEHPIDGHIKLAKTFSEIKRATGHKPILIQGIPHLEYTKSSARYINHSDRMLTNFDDQVNKVATRLAEISAYDSYDYLTVTELLVDQNNVAHTQIGGVPVYYDPVHINTMFSASAGEHFTNKLRTFIQE